MLKKTEILTTVDTIASKRLFVDAKWLATGEAAALDRTLKGLGLIELLPDGITTRCTSLGIELDIDLQQVFMYLLEQCDAVWVLQERQLLDESESEALFHLVETDQGHYEPKLRSRVQHAYRDYHQMTRVH